MNRHSLGVVLVGLLGGAGGAVAGCNFIVGAGDYAVSDDAGILHAEAGVSDGGGKHDGGNHEGGKPSDAGPDKDTGAQSDGGGLLGDPCTLNSDCTRGACGGEWCTEPCVSNSACGSNSLGQRNQCAPNSDGENACVPGCAAQRDCADYAGTTCEQAPILGGTAMICVGASVSEGGPGGDGGVVGDPCSDDGGPTCSVGSCNGVWCTTSCKSAKDKSCGSNTLGVPSFCVEDGNNQFQCFPGCSTNADCTPFANTTCSPNDTSNLDAGYTCSTPFGVVGDPCADNCSADAGATECIESWCSAPCTSPTDTSCGSSSTGESNFCVKTAGTADYTCSPGCTSSDDCAPYPDTFCQPIVRGASGLVCAPSGGLIGDPCSTNTDCTQGTCVGTWCGEDCSDAGASGCGTDTAGMPNQCVLAMDNLNHCFPGCTTASDCTPYPNTTCQALKSGASVCSD